MTTMDPIQQAITGQEELGDLTEPQQALARFYRAFNNRDLAMMEANWDNSERPAAISPFGIVRGWRQLRGVYERLFGSPGKIQAEFYDYTIHVFGASFFAVGRERGHYEDYNVDLLITSRATNIFQRASEGQWHQVHHHVSLEDPELWIALQVAVRQASSRA